VRSVAFVDKRAISAGALIGLAAETMGVWPDFGELDQVVTEDTGFLGGVRRIFT
jgi:hypothetical protein